MKKPFQMPTAAEIAVHTINAAKAHYADINRRMMWMWPLSECEDTRELYELVMQLGGTIETEDFGTYWQRVVDGPGFSMTRRIDKDE